MTHQKEKPKTWVDIEKIAEELLKETKATKKILEDYFKQQKEGKQNAK